MQLAMFWLIAGSKSRKSTPGRPMNTRARGIGFRVMAAELLLQRSVVTTDTRDCVVHSNDGLITRVGISDHSTQ
jgi:hypothetical protein